MKTFQDKYIFILYENIINFITGDRDLTLTIDFYFANLFLNIRRLDLLTSYYYNKKVNSKLISGK